MVMRGLFPFVVAAVLLCVALAPAFAEEPLSGDALIEDFMMQPETRWRFFTDQVMGGVSTGGVAFAQEDGHAFARMTGHVSTANRGGFIQMRLELGGPGLQALGPPVPGSGPQVQGPSGPVPAARAAERHKEVRRGGA